HSELVKTDPMSNRVLYRGPAPQLGHPGPSWGPLGPVVGPVRPIHGGRVGGPSPITGPIEASPAQLWGRPQGQQAKTGNPPPNSASFAPMDAWVLALAAIAG